jgi:hypothetical protein
MWTTRFPYYLMTAARYLHISWYLRNWFCCAYNYFCFSVIFFSFLWTNICWYAFFLNLFIVSLIFYHECRRELTDRRGKRRNNLLEEGFGDDSLVFDLEFMILLGIISFLLCGFIYGSNSGQLSFLKKWMEYFKHIFNEYSVKINNTWGLIFFYSFLKHTH